MYTVYDFLEKIGKYEEFDITLKSGNVKVTKDNKFKLVDYFNDAEDRNEVLDCLEYKVISVDFELDNIICSAD